MKTLILAHPWHGSFNKAILDTLAATYESQGEKYQVIDLHKDGFVASYAEEELSHYNTGHTNDKQVLRYQEMIKNTTEIIFIFPIWWGTMPASLKGFFDRVMLYNFAFNYENGWTPLLNINKGTIITTSQAPSSVFESMIKHGIINLMLGAIGIKNVTWYNRDNISRLSREETSKFLEELKEKV